MFGFGSIKSGPILEHPLIEHNAERYTRPVWMKVRKVKGKRGWLLRRIGRFTAPDPTPEGLGHHAIQIGAYAYELHTDEANQKYLLVQRLSGSQIWAPTVSETVVGYCSLTDEEIAIQAMQVQSWMRGRQGGRYHVRHNNCQHFVEELWCRLCLDGHGCHRVRSQNPTSVSHKTQTLKTGSPLGKIVIAAKECSNSESSSEMSSLSEYLDDSKVSMVSV